MSFLLVAALLAAPQSGEAVVGRWKTPVKNGVVEIQRCGGSVCGKVVSSDGLRANPDLRDVNNSDKSLRTRQIRGMTMISGMKPDGSGGWTGGKIYNADDGKTYTADITMAGPDTLKLRGCIFKPLCKTQTWTRVR